MLLGTFFMCLMRIGQIQRIDATIIEQEFDRLGSQVLLPFEHHDEELSESFIAWSVALFFAYIYRGLELF